MTQSTVDMIDTVVIPGELTISQPIVPPITIHLPLYVRPSRWKNVLLGIPSLVIGVPMLSASILLLHVGVPRIFAEPVSLENIVMMGAVIPFMLLVSVAFTGSGLTCIADALRGDPALLIDANGLRDTRSGFHAPWSSIKSAKVLYLMGGPGSVDLQLQAPAAIWQNPFRVGRMFFRLLPKPDHILVPIAYLDVRSHVVMYTILTLVRDHGGETSAKTPGFDMSLKLLSQPERKLAS